MVGRDTGLLDIDACTTERSVPLPLFVLIACLPGRLGEGFLYGNESVFGPGKAMQAGVPRVPGPYEWRNALTSCGRGAR